MQFPDMRSLGLAMIEKHLEKYPDTNNAPEPKIISSNNDSTTVQYIDNNDGSVIFEGTLAS